MPIDLNVSALIPSILDDLFVDERQQFLDTVWSNVTTCVADAESTNAKFHGALVNHLHILGFGSGGVFGHEHDGNVVFHGEGDRFFHGGHELLHRPSLGVLANGAGPKEGGGLDFHLVFSLHFHNRFDVAHQCSDGCPGSDLEPVIADVGQHGVDVVKMVGARSRET